MSEQRWSHRTNWLGSHAAQPDNEHWTDENGRESAVCRECGYICSLTTDWANWRT
jgi:hypothetical protein